MKNTLRRQWGKSPRDGGGAAVPGGTKDGDLEDTDMGGKNHVTDGIEGKG